MDNGRRIIVHIHHIICIADLDTVRKILDPCLLENRQDLFSSAYQSDSGSIGLCRFHCAQHRCLRGIIAAHGIHDDLHSRTSFLSDSLC